MHKATQAALKHIIILKPGIPLRAARQQNQFG